MRRLVPYPLLSAGLFVAWLLLDERLTVADVIVGIALALALPWGVAALARESESPAAAKPPPRPRVSVAQPWLARAEAIVRLGFRVAVDIVRSNLAVAAIVLRPHRRAGSPGFVAIPLELRDPRALAVLACIVTATPGTLWADFDPARGLLVLHILDLVEADAWRATIKRRYERPLLEIFA